MRVRSSEREPRFKVGDRVRIAEEPFYDCNFGWENGMTNYCGREAIVTGVYPGTYDHTDEYYLDVDEGYFSWCMNCFILEPEVDIEESDKGLDFLFAN